MVRMWVAAERFERFAQDRLLSHGDDRQEEGEEQEEDGEIDDSEEVMPINLPEPVVAPELAVSLCLLLAGYTSRDWKAVLKCTTEDMAPALATILVNLTMR